MVSMWMKSNALSSGGSPYRWNSGNEDTVMAPPSIFQRPVEANAQPTNEEPRHVAGLLSYCSALAALLLATLLPALLATLARLRLLLLLLTGLLLLAALLLLTALLRILVLILVHLWFPFGVEIFERLHPNVR
jgi:hypothetical protein